MIWHAEVVFYFILLVTSASNMQTVYSVCHVCIFCYWVDDRDQNKNDFLKSRTELRVKSIQGPNRELVQNAGTKSAFSPLYYEVIHGICLILCFVKLRIYFVLLVFSTHAFMCLLSASGIYRLIQWWLLSTLAIDKQQLG